METGRSVANIGGVGIVLASILCPVGPNGAECAENRPAKILASEIKFLAVSPDGKELYATSKDNRSFITLASDTCEPKSFVPLPGYLIPRLSPDCSCYRVELPHGAGQAIYSRATHKRLNLAKKAFASPFCADMINNAGNRRYLLEDNDDSSSISCFSLTEDSLLWTTPGERAARFLAVSGDEKVVVAGFSSAVRCYDGANGRERAARQFRKERYFIFPTFGALNEDGSRLVVAGCIEGHDHIEDRKAPGMVVLLDTKSLTEVKRYEYAHLEVSATGITSAAASADLSVVVVAASPDDHGMTAIRLWYPDNGNVRVLQLERYQEVLLSRNGRFLLVCNMSNKGPPMARAYKLPECEELWTLDGDEVLPIPTASAAPAR